MSEKKVFAVAAHPDDIEFMMAGTLLQLRKVGYRIHYMNVADGACGTATLPAAEIVRIRAGEARKAARFLGATYHTSLTRDLHIVYEMKLLRKIAAIVRRVNPEILLVPSPQDYMEDHSNTSRLAVSAAFYRGMRNFVTSPRVAPVTGNCAIYHALPYGLRDGLRKRIHSELYVDTTEVLETQVEALAIHKSQKQWLDESQGLDSYLATLRTMSKEVGRMSRRFKHAEGWRRHNHLGMGPADFDPLLDALGPCALLDRTYEKELS